MVDLGTCDIATADDSTVETIDYLKREPAKVALSLS